MAYRAAGKSWQTALPALPIILSVLLACAGLPVSAVGREHSAGERQTQANLPDIIAAELAAGNRRIVIPPGVYRVKPQHGQHLQLKNLDQVEIIATGVTMICTETTRAITFENCANLTLRGITIDYDPLPFTQGRITAMAPDKRWLDFEIIEGYPERLSEGLIEIFDGKSMTLKRETHYGWKPFLPQGHRRYRVEKADGYQFRPEIDKEEVGDFVLAPNVFVTGPAIPHAILSSHCSNLVLEDVRLYASNCFSFFELYCENTTYRRCSLDRRPPQDDLRQRAVPRLRSGNADAFHSKHAVRGPQIIGCTAKWMGDDAVNICGEYYLILNGQRNTLRILATAPNLRAGDSVELVSYNGMRLPDATIATIRPDGSATAEEQSFLKMQQMDANLKKSLCKPGVPAFTVTLDRDVSLPRGSVIASLRHMGNGFSVRDCDFGFNRSRGILIKASHGRITGNKLTHTGMSAVLVTPEWWWLESGSSSDVAIRGNRIADCGGIAICVTAFGGNGQLAPAGAHHDISICENQITGSPWPVIYISSSRDVTILHNKCALGVSRSVDAGSAGRLQLDLQKPVEIKHVNCDQVHKQ